MSEMLGLQSHPTASNAPTAPGEKLLKHRVAELDDRAAIRALMDESIRALLGPFLTPQQLAASHEIMGLDSRLIEDGTYLMVWMGDRLAGCGGWSRRAKPFGGDHYSGEDTRMLDPAGEPARIRAMYTHPEFARQGVGRAVLSLCEAAAVKAGFAHAELVATSAGELLYRACGYDVLERFEQATSSGVAIPVVRMGKRINSA
jgi:GNAT superfamily N-acetyltransferase